MDSGELRIGLFGGSFDPPHMGHKALVEEALNRLGLNAVWVIPAGVPVHRTLSMKASAEQRLAWVKAMFSDDSDVRIKEWEMNHSEPVAAISTLRQFADHCPDTVPLWLCGADSFASMDQWVDYPEHQKLCNIAVFSRSGEPQIQKLSGWKPLTIQQWLSEKHIGPGHIIQVHARLPDISATRVRQRAASRESLQGLVDSRICAEIESRYGSI